MTLPNTVTAVVFLNNTTNMPSIMEHAAPSFERSVKEQTVIPRSNNYH
jgi:hypothetical protein